MTLLWLSVLAAFVVAECIGALRGGECLSDYIRRWWYGHRWRRALLFVALVIIGLHLVGVLP